MSEQRKIGVVRDASSMRVVAQVMELLRTCDADLAELQGDVRSPEHRWDIGSIRARLEQIRFMLVQG